MSPTWDESVDVVIIGSGFAGLAAAIEAVEAGASVTILEKMKGHGGNSVISDGSPAAAGTPQQAALGIQDSPDLMYQDMVTAGLGLNHPDLARLVAESSAAAVQWTIDHIGVRYLDRMDHFGGHSVARCFATVNRTGADIIKPLMRKVKELGLTIRTRIYLEKILTGNDGEVTGVLVRQGYVFPDANSGAPMSIRARKAVVLATGGFANDIPFRTIQDPRLTEEVDSTNRACTTGEALREALRLGAAPVQLSCIQLGPWASPDEKNFGVGPDFADYIAFPYGLVVDPDTCKRFVNELADRKTLADAILNTGQSSCIAVTDAAGIEVSGYSVDNCLKKGILKKFDSLADLAGAYGLDHQTLAETVERFNGFVERKLDPDYEKPILKDACPLNKPPFFGMRVWPKVHHTMGGVQIDTGARVMDLNQRPIKGLYAAGEVTGGVHGACRLGSCAITDCLVFGRIAGRNAAAGPSRAEA